MSKTREILLTNDDGFRARGIRVLAQLLRGYGNVTVVAPFEPQSGRSVALTLDRPLMIDRPLSEAAGDGLGSLRLYTLTGTPADCTKMGVNLLLHEGLEPGLLVSGINHGSNASAASVYSGTLGAAIEGTVYGIPSVGLSIDTHAEDPDFSGVLQYAPRILDRVLEDGLPPQVYLNVNFPGIPAEAVRGIRLARQGAGRWVREFDHRTTLRGRHYFWMVGEFEDLENGDTTGTAFPADHQLLDAGYVTVVPHRVDTTDRAALEQLREKWHFERT